MNTRSTIDTLEEFTYMLNMRDYNRYLIELFFKSCPFSICITDSNGIILVVNDEFSTRCGRDQSEIIGNTPNFLRSGVHTPEFYASMWKTVLSGATYRGKVINRRKNGTMYEEYVVIIPLFNTIKTVTNFATISQYIKEYEEIDSSTKDELICG